MAIAFRYLNAHLGAALATGALGMALACGGGGGGGNSTPSTPPVTGATIKSSTASGDFTMAGALAVQDGKVNLNMPAIRDPSNPAIPVDPSKVTITGSAEVNTSGDSAYLAAAADAPPTITFTVAPISSTSDAPIDITFINDTTGSMSGSTVGIANSIASFTDSITKAGVNARFAMYTYGDAFATKAASGSGFTKGLGDFLPPDIDSTERPYLGLSTYTDFKPFIDELKLSSALGIGGGDGPENTVGALDYANKHVAFRSGASKVFIAIGDNPSHQAGDGDVTGYPAAFVPRAGADVASELTGSATVHVIGHDYGSAPYYPLKNLSDATGGGFIELPSGGIVDLNALKITDWVTSGFTGKIPGLTPGTYKVTLTATYAPVGGAAPKVAKLVLIVTVT